MRQVRNAFLVSAWELCSITRFPPITEQERHIVIHSLGHPWSSSIWVLPVSCYDASQLQPAALLQAGLIATLRLDETKLARYLIRIEDGYPDNPYHTKTHAADVLQTMHMLLTYGGLLGNGCCHDEIALLACYLSAVSDINLQIFIAL